MPTFRNDGNVSVYVESLIGKVSVVPGDSVTTYTILESPFTKTSDEPYYPLVLISDPAFASPGTKTGFLNCKVIRLFTEDEISVKANSENNPYVLQLPVGQAIDIENLRRIESLVFIGSGTVKIEGF